MFLVNLQDYQCQKANTPFFRADDIIGNHTLRIPAIGNITECISQKPTRDMAISIEMCGHSIMEKYPKDIIFITGMGIPSTMSLATLNAFQLANTYPLIKKIFQNLKKKLEPSTLIASDLSLHNGIKAPKDERGTANTPTTPCQQLEDCSTIESVNSVLSSSRANDVTKNFVRINVNLNGEETINLTMNLEYVRDVIENLEQTSMIKSNVVLKHAGESIRKEKVYNLTVKDYHVFFVCNTLTINCLDAVRYCMTTAFFDDYGDRSTSMKPSEWTKLYHKHSGYMPNQDREWGF